MRVTFAGVGEAFDETLANTSVLAESEGFSVLLDCGFTAASAFWTHARHPLELGALHISHFHGDHYFGVPALLVRSVEEGRIRPLTILGQAGVEERVVRLMEMAYRSTLSRAQFDIRFIECAPGDDVFLGDMRFGFAASDHPMECLSVRVESDGRSLFYSGDGRPTDDTRALAAGCDLVVHESFSLEPDMAGHGTVDSSIGFALEAGAAHLALVHVRRMVRRNYRQVIIERLEKANGIHAFLPEPGEVTNL